MISTGVFTRFRSSPHDIGSRSSAISLRTSAGKLSGVGESLRYSAANGIWRNMSTVICGIIALNSGCKPALS